MIGAGNEWILGYDVYSRTMRECVREIADSVQKNEKHQWLACLNPHSYVMALRLPAFASALMGANWLIPDGAGIVLASKVLGGRIHGRITGPDLFEALHDELQSRDGATVFFLGSTEDNLTKIREKMQHDWPGIEVVGTYSPPFKATFSVEDTNEMISAVNVAKPDLLWVGMTAPKQEQWIADAIDRLDVKFAGSIGAVFDFYVGRIRRSHPLFRTMGLEWLPRLFQEPRRLWRRMLISAPIFLWHVFKARIGIMPRK